MAEVNYPFRVRCFLRATWLYQTLFLLSFQLLYSFINCLLHQCQHIGWVYTYGTNYFEKDFKVHAFGVVQQHIILRVVNIA